LFARKEEIMAVRNGKFVYGAWAGMPNGIPEDETCCIVEVSTRERWASYHQCFRKRGFGIDGLFCKQHATQQNMQRTLKERADFLASYSRKVDSTLEADSTPASMPLM
jgi:hypothetical protein